MERRARRRESRVPTRSPARVWGPNFGRLVHAKGFGHRIESRPRTLRIYGIKTLRYGQPSARAEAHNIAARISGSGHSAVTDASTPRASPRAHATPRPPQLGADPDYNTTATLLTTVLRGSGRELELECPLLTGMSITEQVRLSSGNALLLLPLLAPSCRYSLVISRSHIDGG